VGDPEEVPERDSRAAERDARGRRDRVRVRRLSELARSNRHTEEGGRHATAAAEKAVADAERKALVAAMYVDHGQWVAAIVRNRGCPEDVAQKVFLKFWRDVSEGDLIERLAAGFPVWAALNVNAKHLCMSWWREHGRVPVPVELPPRTDPDWAERSLELAEKRAVVQTFERTLDVVDHLVWILASDHDLSTPAIARLIGGLCDGAYRTPAALEQAVGDFGWDPFLLALKAVGLSKTAFQRKTWTKGAVEQAKHRLWAKFRRFVSDRDKRNG
jgi:DNA-directed RNA polymerase specialized sigma24 family protein